MPDRIQAAGHAKKHETSKQSTSMNEGGKPQARGAEEDEKADQLPEKTKREGQGPGHDQR